MARLVSLAVLLTLIVFLGITFFQVIAPFLLPLFLAGVTAILCQPLYQWLLTRTSQRSSVAAGLATAAVLLMVLAPILVGTFIATVELRALASKAASRDWEATLRSVRARLEIDSLAAEINEYFPGAVESPEALQRDLEANAQVMLKQIAERTMGFVASTLGVLGAILSLVIGVMMFVIALYYFLADGPALLAASEELIPVQIDYQRELRTQFALVVRAVVVATFVAAVTQGLVTAGALALVGIGHFFTFLILATLASMIPLAGAWLVWAPCAVWLGVNGHWPSAVFLTVVGVLVVGTMDNVIRTYVLNTDAKLHPLLAFVSVLGALQVMGLWGIFVGPVVASCLHALVKIFNMELRELSKEKFGGLALQGESAGSVPPPMNPQQALGGEPIPDSAPASQQSPVSRGNRKRRGRR